MFITTSTNRVIQKQLYKQQQRLFINVAQNHSSSSLNHYSGLEKCPRKNCYGIIVQKISSYTRRTNNRHHLPVSSLAFSTTNTFATASSSKQRTKQNSFQNYDLSNSQCNIPQSIASRVGTNLHLQTNHPLHTIKSKIESYWQQRHLNIHDDDNSKNFESRDEIDPVVSTIHNFDSLLIPPDHVSRSKSDTYYVDDKHVLRTHTSAHQTTLLKEGIDRFLVTGDVYRLVHTCYFLMKIKINSIVLLLTFYTCPTFTLDEMKLTAHIIPSSIKWREYTCFQMMN